MRRIARGGKESSGQAERAVDRIIQNDDDVFQAHNGTE
jgi:hypothetical protein